MHKFTLSTLLETVPEELVRSFDNLPSTEHKDGKFRLRRYSVFTCRGDQLDTTEFTQSSEYNKYQGDVARTFQPIEKEIATHEAFLSLLTQFREIADLNHEDIDVHQMRIITEGSDTSEISPEGAHQDGYDVIAIVGINRKNITGGNLLLYHENGGNEILSYAVKSGEAVILNDREMWHNGQAINTVNPDEPGFMDAFILLSNRKQ